MLIARMYGLMWLAVAGLAGLLWATGSLTFPAIMVLGFIASVLTGAGLLVVYPAMMHMDLAGQKQKN